MIDAVMTDEIEAIVQDVAREWAAQWTAEHLFISRGELSRTGAVAVVTVALGGPAKEHVSRLEIDVAGRCVTRVRPVVPSWPRGRDVVTAAMLAWAERCWPEVERVALERGARAPACTGMVGGGEVDAGVVCGGSVAARVGAPLRGAAVHGRGEIAQ
jgi:hypothetical protein